MHRFFDHGMSKMITIVTEVNIRYLIRSERKDLTVMPDEILPALKNIAWSTEETESKNTPPERKQSGGGMEVVYLAVGCVVFAFIVSFGCYRLTVSMPERQHQLPTPVPPPSLDANDFPTQLPTYVQATLRRLSENFNIWDLPLWFVLVCGNESGSVYDIGSLQSDSVYEVSSTPDSQIYETPVLASSACPDDVSSYSIYEIDSILPRGSRCSFDSNIPGGSRCSFETPETCFP